jgi:hypothetical protein
VCEERVYVCLFFFFLSKLGRVIEISVYMYVCKCVHMHISSCAYMYLKSKPVEKVHIAYHWKYKMTIGY